MPSDDRPSLRFWGVRGSIPTPRAGTLRHGGNTPCVEIRLPGGPCVVLDAGTGARELGSALRNDDAARSRPIAVVLSHFHWDHIQGLPFFAPLYDADADITFYGCPPRGRLEDVLRMQMNDPYFPVDFDRLASRRRFVEVQSEEFRIGSLTVRPFPLHHPGGARGFRIESAESSVVYATDCEHGDPELDAVLMDHASGADHLIYDAQFTPDEHRARVGWGHSTWLEGTRIAREAGAGQLILFHHDPSRDDAQCDEIVELAQERFETTIAAREGESIAL